MTTLRQMRDECLQTLQGYGLSQPRVSFLSAAATATDTSLVVSDASGFEVGLAEVGDELVFVQSVDYNTNTLTISPDGRGFYSTTAAAHASGTRVVAAPTWPKNRVAEALNDVIESTFPTLFGTDQTQFTFNPSVSTYEMPADAVRALSVEADTLGASREQQRVTRYSFNTDAPTDEFTTGRSITLMEGVAPGKTVTVTYTKEPSRIGLDDELTVSGLRSTAKLAVVYGACAQLMSFMDVSRLPVDAASAEEADERNPLGMASRISGQLQARHEQELEKERKRLRQITPVPIIRRTR